jgi:NADH-quinone oxidoreductase subunit E
MNTAAIDALIEKHGGDASAVIAILQDIQRSEGYLPREDLKAVAEKLKAPLSRLFALATFYRSFSLKPTGRHKVRVCMGTACHVRGGQAVLEQLGRDLGIAPGGTTGDRRFTLETVRCLGCCSIGPVVQIDNEIAGRVRMDKAAKLLKKYE